MGLNYRSVLVSALLLASLVSLPEGSPQAVLLPQVPAGMPSPANPSLNLAKKPPQTHRFWSGKNWFSTNLTTSGAPYKIIPEPLTLETKPEGLLVGYSPSIMVKPGFFLHPVQPDFVIGATGLHARQVSISDYSDWMVEFDFGPFKARVGRGMPFVYVLSQGDDPVITFVADPHVFFHAGNVLGVSLGPNSYGLFCPSGGGWTGAGRVFSCQLPAGRKYFSAALLPDPEALHLFARFAFSFPQTTRVDWKYDEASSQVTTRYSVSTKAMEGKEADFLQALYPHQYAAIRGANLHPTYAYASARGPMKLLEGAEFETVDRVPGILPFLPVGAAAADRRMLATLVAADAKNASVFPAIDTYATGKELNRAAQLLPLTEVAIDVEARRKLTAALEAEFHAWFHPQPNAKRGFFYDAPWSTLLGYPGSFGSVEQLNDHHFHYGYWIHAAALLGLYDPAWFQREDGGKALAWLIRDIATIDRADTKFPFLRHFDAYAGHSWASGQAPFGDGENEESSSEAVNAWAGILLYATETGDRPLRDAAIWMYTLEANAAREYWFNDGPVQTFPVGYKRTQIANLFDGKSDSATWFGDAAAFEHGIEFMPFTGSSLYLGRDAAYCRRNLAEVTGPGGQVNPFSKDWPDLMELYEAFTNPSAALEAWKQTAFTFDGESRAHEFAWLSALNELGEVDESITANTPFHAAFRLPGRQTHVAFNLAATPRRVDFSDGYSVTIPPFSYAVEGAVLHIAR
jgi:endoglucanase Acf2